MTAEWETTKTSTDSEKPRSVLVEVSGRQSQLTALKGRIEERLKDTRLIWQAIHAQTEKIVAEPGRQAEALLRIKH